MTGAEGQSVSSRARGLVRLGAPVAVVLGVWLVGIVGGEQTDRVVIVALLNLTIVLGLFIFSGTSGLLSFGHVAFVAIGAYTAALLSLSISEKQAIYPNMPGWIGGQHVAPLWAVLAGALLATVAGAITALPIMRLNGLAGGLATFALLIISHTVASNWQQVTQGAQSLTGVPVVTTTTYAAAAALLALLGAFVFSASRVALQLRAARDEQIAAEALGVPIYGLRCTAWITSSFVAGLAGALYGLFLGAVTPNSFWLSLTVVTLAMLVIGGINSVWGAVVGSVGISLLTYALQRVEDGPTILGFSVPARPGLADFGVAAALLGTLLLRPDGITRGREAHLPNRWAERVGRDPTPSADEHGEEEDTARVERPAVIPPQ